MSGPKSSYYDVTAAQRQRLEEERRRREEEERRRREEERRRREEEERRRREEEERRRREEEERRRREEEERRRREEEERRRRKEEARQARIKQADAILDNAFTNFQLFQIKEEKQVTENPPEQQSTPKKEFDSSEFERRLDLMAGDSRLSVALLAKVAQTKRNFESITDSTFRKNFTAVSITPLLKECNKYLQLYEETADLRIEYKVVCDMAGEPETAFEISPTTIQNIQNEITRLRKKIARDDEKSYISKCLDEVMSDMGYDVIGHREVTKRNGSHFKNELFSYADGTAVNVTLSDDGHIAMELCGLDDTDRLPEADESEKLCEHMESFCEDFGEIERRLAEKGVILRKRIQRLPPSVEYAQILNVSDYKLTGDVEHFNYKHHREKTSRPLQRSN